MDPDSTVHNDPEIEKICPVCHPERKKVKRVLNTHVDPPPTFDDGGYVPTIKPRNKWPKGLL